MKQWLEDRVVPEYRVTKAVKAKQGAGYDVTATVQNRGTGTMPVEIAAVAGERWEKPKKVGGAAERSRQSPGYREARNTVALGPGESKTVTIRCAFQPERVVIDPDVRVLQLRRKQAEASL